MGRKDEIDLPVERLDDDQADALVSPMRWRRWYPLLALGVIVVVALSVVIGDHRARTGPTKPGPARTVPVAGATSGGTTLDPDRQPVATVDIGRPLLAVPASWELFGRGGDLVRLELRAGRVTLTAIPPLRSSGPVSLVVGADRALIRPLDFVTGYVVPDGEPAQPLSGLLGNAGPALPGPDSDHLWIDSDRGERRMELVGFDGTPTGVSIPTPDTFATSDGTGYLLLEKADGVYLARPAGANRVTTGTLLAVGPTRWLTAECDRRPRCDTVITDRANGVTRVLGPAEPGPAPGPGVISPNGQIAAIRRQTSTGSVLHLLDLTSGQDRRTTMALPDADGGDLVWAPDSSLLFAVDRDGQLGIIDVGTTQVHDLGVHLPPLSQLALRVTTQPNSDR